MDLRNEVACLCREGGSKRLSPMAEEAALRLFNFLDEVLDYLPPKEGELPTESVPELPRGYLWETLAGGDGGVCVPLTCDCDPCDLGAQLAYFAADIATGWLEELCVLSGPVRSKTIREACGLVESGGHEKLP